jgi:hypothetical protein
VLLARCQRLPIRFISDPKHGDGMFFWAPRVPDCCRLRCLHVLPLSV